MAKWKKITVRVYDQKTYEKLLNIQALFMKQSNRLISQNEAINRLINRFEIKEED